MKVVKKALKDSIRNVLEVIILKDESLLYFYPLGHGYFPFTKQPNHVGA